MSLCVIAVWGWCLAKAVLGSVERGVTDSWVWWNWVVTPVAVTALFLVVCMVIIATCSLD